MIGSVRVQIHVRVLGSLFGVRGRTGNKSPRTFNTNSEIARLRAKRFGEVSPSLGGGGNTNREQRRVKGERQISFSIQAASELRQ